MGEWIYRASIDQDWISLIFFFNLLLVVGLHYFEASRFWDLLKFYSSNIYISKYTTDRNLSFQGAFNTLSALLIFSSVSLLILWGIKETSGAELYAFEFYYILFAIIFFGWIRFMFVQFVLKQMNMLNKINSYHFRAFTHNTQFSLFLSILLFIGHYTHLAPEIITVFLFMLFLIWGILQAGILLSFIKSNPKDIFYLIFYLCTVKIAPWLWLYFLIIETRM
jgi:hypothetical protein